MTKAIKIKKGLDIRLKGKAQATVKEIAVGGIYSVVPDDFYGFKPKPVVKEGDAVLVGDALFVNKAMPELKVVSPVSGKIVGVNRGERRKLVSIDIEADADLKYKEIAKPKVESLTPNEAKAYLLDAGLLAFIHKRPFDIVANPNETPKGIFVSAFNSMPLSQDFSVALKGNEKYFQKGIDLLGRIAPVTVCLSEEQGNTQLAQLEDAEVYVVSGPNPAGNVGVQINHISPINKGEVVWTLLPENVIFIGKAVIEGRVDLTRTIAVAGSEVKDPSYVKALVGTQLKEILKDNIVAGDSVRIINGNPLVGKVSAIEGYLASDVTEVTVIPEGDDNNEVLGWIMPRFNDFSTSRSYFSWMQGKKEYNLDARIKGGERHIIMSGEYDRVFPMNIYAGYLIKSILTGDIDRMEALGIYEVAPEDFAVAEFVDSSKLELQRIVREGLDMLRKELE